MKTKILQYSEVDSEEWDDFVYKNKGGYAYHLYDVIALDRWENDKNKSFAIFDELDFIQGGGSYIKTDYIEKNLINW